MRRCLAIAVALTGLTVAVSPAAALDVPSGSELSKKGAKGKKKKCKKGKVAITINRRRLCRSPKAALPAPKAADQRLLAAQAALGFNPGKLRDRRGRKVVSAAALLGPAKTKTAERAIKEGLGVLDRLSTRAPLSSLSSPLATASTPSCGPGGGPPEATQSYSGGGFDARVELDKGAAQIGVDLGEGGARAEIDFGLCELAGDKLKIPECPDAQGQLEGSDETLMYVNMRIFQGGDLLLSQSFNFSGETEIKPIQVDDDAKLEYLEVDHTYRTQVVLGGSSQAFGRISFKMTYHGSTRVTFPGGSYDPTHTDVEVNLDIEGAAADELHEVRDVEFDESLKFKREADKNFAAEVDKVIAKARERETGWQQPNRCAEIKFEPTSETLKLKRNQAGSFKARLDSKKGGSPPGAKWTRLDAQNATVTPGNALANPASFSYTVTNVGKDVVVRAKFKAVSQAGVAEAQWVQKTEDRETINRLVGSFGGEVSIPTLNGPSVTSWSGSATLLRATPAVVGGPVGSFDLASGGITYHVSGQEGLGVTGCQWSGTKVVELPAGAASGTAGVLGAAPHFSDPPYGYSITIGTQFGAEFTFTREDCPDGAKEYNGTQQTLPFIVRFDTDEQESPDGIAYSGSKEENEGGATTKDSWNFEGRP